MNTATTAETKAAVLSEYDFIIVVDRSGSMGTEDMSGGRSRWKYMQETAAQFARDMGKLDSDGVGLVVFGGSNIESFDGVNADKIIEIFANRNPGGGTPLAEALTAALKLAGKSDKKDFIVVFTDGEPDDKAAVKKVIINQANSQATDDACTILFIPVGSNPSDTAFLKTLDDDLTGAKFDIVDVKTLAEAEAFSSTADLVIAAIND